MYEFIIKTKINTFINVARHEKNTNTRRYVKIHRRAQDTILGGQKLLHLDQNYT